jgi:hypothetical protein
MLSIYKLVAERRDRNQSIKRKRRYQNMHNAYKAKIEGVGPFEYRNSPDCRAIRTGRTMSDNAATAALCDMLLAPSPYPAKPADLGLQTVCKQIAELETKLEDMQTDLSRQMTDISNKLAMLNNNL